MAVERIDFMRETLVVAETCYLGRFWNTEDPR
jgi:hypothetical protein